GELIREAYSQEAVSFGFWFGDDSIPEPCFYSYTVPEPEGLAEAPLSPPQAEWSAGENSHLALLRYADAREQADPKAAVLDFLQSAYLAGAKRIGWDIDALACPGGVTDPYAQGRRSTDWALGPVSPDTFGGYRCEWKEKVFSGSAPHAHQSGEKDEPDRRRRTGKIEIRGERGRDRGGLFRLPPARGGGSRPTARGGGAGLRRQGGGHRPHA